MRIIILNIITALLLFFSQQGNAQETSTNSVVQDTIVNQDRINQLNQERDRLLSVEKEQLKKEVARIEEQLANGAITKEEAENQKMYFATLAAENIENRNAIIDNQIALLRRDQNLEAQGQGLRVIFGGDTDGLFGIDIKPKDESHIEYDKRTYSSLVISAGLNNAIIESQSLEDSPYKLGGSRYFEIGYAWRTRVFENTNWLRFKYGFSFQFNGLKMKDNQYYVEQGEQTVLQTFTEDLDKSKIRFDHFVLPLHFEIGTSEKEVNENSIRYHTSNKFKVGFGGYGGFNLTTLQKLKYEEDGQDRKDKLKSNYNTNNFIYGLSGYVGVGNFSVYLKYDLNTIFKHNPIEQRNISLGVRFDL